MRRTTSSACGSGRMRPKKVKEGKKVKRKAGSAVYEVEADDVGPSLGSAPAKVNRVSPRCLAALLPARML